MAQLRGGLSAERVYAGKSAYSWVENRSYMASCLDLHWIKISIIFYFNVQCFYWMPVFIKMIIACYMRVGRVYLCYVYCLCFCTHIVKFVIVVMGKNLEALI